MLVLRRIRSIIGWNTIVVVFLAVLSTWASKEYGLSASFPLALIATSVVFPIVFSIGGAYKRRETALAQYGSLKAHGRALYFAARDWDEDENVGAERMRENLATLLQNTRALFVAPQKDLRINEKPVYQTFSELSRQINSQMRSTSMATGEVSRANQYLSKMFVAFENIKHIYQYRTPRTLRAFSEVFIILAPVLYGPYFASQADEFSNPILMYVTPVLLALVLTALDNVQAHLENPFDQIGADDITISVEPYIDNLD